MVVCPCGVMVPAAGVGRARRGPRGPTGCFDSPATVTTQPKEPQDTPASVEKLAAAAAATADPSGIPRPVSRTSKNKGTTNKGSEDIKGDHSSRTTLALATTESGRYVGTRPLRSNRSPTPTLHRLPQKTSRDHSANGGRPSKHLPAVRTSPTSPLDNQDTGASRTSRFKGPTALPRNNAVNQRMNELNSNQRRLLKQNLSPDEKPPRNPATKTSNDSDSHKTTNSYASNYENITQTQTRNGASNYENIPQTRTRNEEQIYENVRVLNAAPPPAFRDNESCMDDDVTGQKMNLSTDSLTSEDSTVWLSDSWKYNTIKKAPEFNIFEFPEFDLQTETENRKLNTKEINENEEDALTKKDIKVEKGKKKLRSRLPLFGWKSDKENKGKPESTIKTFQTQTKVPKPDNKWTHKNPNVLKSPASTHRSKIEKPLTDNVFQNFENSPKKDINLCPAENGRGGIPKNPIRCRTRKRASFMPYNERRKTLTSPVKSQSPTKVTDQSDQMEAGWRYNSGNVSSEHASCASPLISPGNVSLRASQMVHAARASPLSSPTPSRHQVSPKTHGGGSSLEKVPSFPSSSSFRYTEVPNQEIYRDESPKKGTSSHPLESKGDNLSSWSSYLTSRLHHLTENQRQEPTNEHTFAFKNEQKPVSRSTVPVPKSTDLGLLGNPCKPPYKIASMPEWKGNAEEDKKEIEEEQEEETSCTSQETKGPSIPPGLSGEVKKRWKANASKGGVASRMERKGNSNFARCPPKTRHLPSPTPSCPPSVDERRTPVPWQYQSLPQLHSDSRDYYRLHHSSQRGSQANTPPSEPYYVGDLHRISPQGTSRSRRYSRTSLIDQALECLEFSSPSTIKSNIMNTNSPLSPINKISSQAASISPRKNENVQLSPVHNQQMKMSDISLQEDPWASTSARYVASPILPPLPASVLDHHSPPSASLQKTENTSPEFPTNLASICILSLDLTVDCEEFNGTGINVVNIKNNTQYDQDLDEMKCENEDKNNLFTKEELLTESFNDEEEEDKVSVKSASLSIEEIYYENDDYDSTEENSSDFISEEQQRKLDQSIALLSEQHYDNLAKKLTNDGVTKNTFDSNEEDDFIEIDCDVKPMETLKRPLVYGYGSRPVRTLHGPSFLEKRLSQASNVSDYLEMDMIEAMCKGEANENRRKSDSCMNLRETYWDYWQAKQGTGGNVNHQSSSSENSSSNCSPRSSNCPSDKFCYDPEVLLAHVRCPKSLEEATFKQYSAYVKSHIYDYFGNVHEALNEYGLSSARRDWICSQPELLPDTSRLPQNSGNLPLDYSSEPELTNGGGRDSPYEYPMRETLPRLPHPPLHSKDPSQDSGTWTYLQSPQESSSNISTTETYPVPLPRSTSSLSHIGPGTYNPWHHLLPDITPPRTPRHSMYHTSTTAASTSRSTSPSPTRGSHSSLTTSGTTKATVTAHHTTKSIPKPAVTHMPTPTKRSFLPNFSKVVKSPLRKPVFKLKASELDDSMDVVPELPTVHPSIQKRTHTTTSSKSSSSSSSSSSASSKDSIATVIPATAKNKGTNWLMRHFGGTKYKMTAV